MNKFHIIDVNAIAEQAMANYGFTSRFPPTVLKEAESLASAPDSLSGNESIEDMRSLLWSSIDNEDSLDLDQVEYCVRRSNGDIRVKVAIADVDALIPKNSKTSQFAAQNATSVYTGVKNFPMLPERLSTNLTSLKEGEDRLAVVSEYIVKPDGNIEPGRIYRALVHNHAKLVYEPVGEWLEGKSPLPEVIAKVAGLEEQVRLQDEASQRLQISRRKQGALELVTVEVKPVMEDGKVIDLIERRENRAHILIENFMISANRTMVNFLDEKGMVLIQRIVPPPVRWPRIVELAQSTGEHLPPEPDAIALADFLDRRRAADPQHFPDLSLAVIKLMGSAEYAVVQPGVESEGHFGLAVQDYTHSTAPNRRYVDLVIQRLLKASLVRAPAPYKKSELQRIAKWCSDRDQYAKKVERFMRKVVGTVILNGRIGEEFDSIVTGANDKGTYVRLLSPPVEGRVVRGEKGLDVGEKVRVRLLRMVPEKGYIDFERANGKNSTFKELESRSRKSLSTRFKRHRKYREG